MSCFLFLKTMESAERTYSRRHRWMGLSADRKGREDIMEHKETQKQQMTGYPSVDKPWLKYYSEEAINAPLPECTAYELLYQNNKDFPNDVALIYYGRRFSYGELFENIEKAARAFWSLGVRQGDIVILCTVNMPETVYAFYGLNRLGAVANLVDPRTNEDSLRKYIKECNAKIVVTVNLASSKIQKAAKESSAEHIVVVSPSDSLSLVKRVLYNIKNRIEKEDGMIAWRDFIRQGKDGVPDYPPYEKDICSTIAYTGGTTGIPKGVMLTNDNINAVTFGYKYTGIPFERQQKYFNDLPPFIMYGIVLAMHTPLCYGLKVILHPIFNSGKFPEQFKKYKPNHFSGVNDHVKYLASDSSIKHMDLSFLITSAIGGDFLNEKTESDVNEFLKSHGCKYEVVKGYGMTELGATACTSFEGANEIGSVGIPLVANVFKVMDLDSGEELGYNQTGEIWISSPSIMQGYYRNPEATAEIICADRDGMRWIRTGDLGHIDERGLIFLEGRIKRIYSTVDKGQPAKIFPGLVEDVLKKSNDVYDCTVVGRFVAHKAYYEAIAYVILKDKGMQQKKVISGLAECCREKLPSYMWPVEYRFLDDFPRTPIGKVDFRELERMAAEDE